MPPKSPLAPIQSTTIFVAAAVSLALRFAVSPDFAWGVFLTALWAVVWFRSLEGILRAAVRPQGQPRATWRIVGWGAVKLAVYAVAVWGLFSRPFPALSHAVGFTLMMVVLAAVGALQRSRTGPGRPRQDDDANSQQSPP